MAKKEFSYRGKTLDEIKAMSLDKLIVLLPARARRSLKREMRHGQKKLLQKIRKNKRKLRTHCRDMVVLPEMIGKTLEIYTGKEWQIVLITPQMLGHYLGEFAPTRKKVSHSAPGIGATRSSASMSVR